MKIKINNKSTNPLPAYATDGASGLDLRAFLSSSITLKPMDSIALSTGLYIEIPIGFEAQVRSRSGMALNHQIVVLNSPGTIDSDFRGEIKVILKNLSEKDFIINNGDRIAQLVVARYEKIEWSLSTELSSTSRDQAGFGSTGIL